MWGEDGGRETECFGSGMKEGRWAVEAQRRSVTGLPKRQCRATVRAVTRVPDTAILVVQQAPNHPSPTFDISKPRPSTMMVAPSYLGAS